MSYPLGFFIAQEIKKKPQQSLGLKRPFQQSPPASRSTWRLSAGLFQRERGDSREFDKSLDFSPPLKKGIKVVLI